MADNPSIDEFRSRAIISKHLATAKPPLASPGPSAAPAVRSAAYPDGPVFIRRNTQQRRSCSLFGCAHSTEPHFYHPAAQPLIQALGLTSADQLLLPITVAFYLAALVAGSMRMVLAWVSTRLSFATGADLSIDIYRRPVYQPYAVHVARNSSEVITGISTKANGVTSALDNETEQAVMQAIEGLSEELTILIIAHRLTTLKNCTQIIQLADGGIRRVGSYQDIVTIAA